MHFKYGVVIEVNIFFQNKSSHMEWECLENICYVIIFFWLVEKVMVYPRFICTVAYYLIWNAP